MDRVSPWQINYKQPHFVTTSTSLPAVSAYPGRPNGNGNYTRSTAARLSSVELQRLYRAGYLDDQTDHDSSVLILVAKLDPDNSILTFEIVGYDNDYAHTLPVSSAGGAQLRCSMTFHWPSYVESKLSDLGFVRGKDESTDDSGVDILGILGLLNFTGVDDRAESLKNTENYQDGTISPLRIFLLSAQGGLWMYDPLVFFTQRRKHDLLEHFLLFGEKEETGFSDNLISNFDAIWAGNLSIAELNLEKPIKHQFAQIHTTAIRVHSEYCIIYGTGRLLLTNNKNLENDAKKKSRRKQKHRDIASFVIYLSCINDRPKERIMNIYPNKVPHVVVPLFRQRENLILFQKQENKSRWSNIYSAPHHKMTTSDDLKSIYFHSGGESMVCPIETEGIQPCYVLPKYETRKMESDVEEEQVVIQSQYFDKFESPTSMMRKGQFARSISQVQPVILFHGKSLSHYSIFSLRESTHPRHVFSFLMEHQGYDHIMQLVDILWEHEGYNLVDGSSRLSFKDTKNSALIDSGVAVIKEKPIFREELIQIYLQSYISFIVDGGGILEDKQFYRVQFYLTSESVASNTITYLLGSAILFYEERKYSFQTHLMDLLLFSLSRGSNKLSFDDILPIMVRYMPQSLGVQTPYAEGANLVQENIRLIVKYDLISEYLQYCWGSLETSVRYIIMFIADDRKSSFPFLQYLIVHDWILEQLEKLICDQEVIVDFQVLLKLVSCIIGRQVIKVQTGTVTEDNVCPNELLRVHHEYNQQCSGWCQECLSCWDHNLLLTTLLVLSSQLCEGGFGIIVNGESDSIASSDGNTSSEVDIISVETLVCTLGNILTPRSEYTLFGVEHDELLLYVDFQRILKYCHQLGNIYAAGVILDKIDLILIGILQNSGLQWTIERCWQVLSNESVGSKGRADYLQNQVPKKSSSFNMYHLHLLTMLESNNDPKELKLILRAVLLLNLHEFVGLGEGDNGAFILQILLFDDEFSTICASCFDVKKILDMAQKCCGLTECLPEYVVTEIINEL